jgi:hypothetical protein
MPARQPRRPQNRKTDKTVTEELPKIQSQNPDFTELLRDLPDESLPARLWPKFQTANDELPPYEYETEQDWMIVSPAPFSAPAPFVLVEATAIQDPTDTNPKGWPARNAEPTHIAITGSIPAVPDGD